MDTDKQYLARLAPCGLHCGKCFAFAQGDIREASRKLQSDLGGFKPYAKRFEKQIHPVFAAYPQFAEMLEYFAKADCGGCRKEKCRFYTNCKVRACVAQKGVDFCYECPEFPCGHTGLDENLYKRHVAINERMREIGPAAYYEQIKDTPRY